MSDTIFRDRDTGKWHAWADVDGDVVHVGSFDDPVVADTALTTYHRASG